MRTMVYLTDVLGKPVTFGETNQLKVPQLLRGQNVLKQFDLTMYPMSVIQRINKDVFE